MPLTPPPAAGSEGAVVDVDPFAAEALEDPYPLYERLRSTAPVWEVPGTGLHLVTGHAEIAEVVNDPDRYSSTLAALLLAGGEGVSLVEGGEALGPAAVLAVADPPDHTRHRRLVRRSFSERAVGALEPAVREAVARPLATGLEQRRIEWMGSVASPLPVMTIARVLGLPDADVSRLEEWSDAGVELLGGVATPERMDHLLGTTGRFLAYCSDQVDRARGGRGSHVVGILGEAVDHGTLSPAEATAMLLQLVIAGAESTASLVGSAARILAEQPSLQSELRRDRTRVAAFVEETLRLESPFRGHFRVATGDSTLGGTSLPKSSRLMLMWGAANRDAEQYRCPGEVDLDRENPRGHFGFGSGLHFCIGAPLARLQARIAIDVLLDSTDGFTLADDVRAPHHVPSLFVRRLAHLHLRLECR